MKKYYKLTDQNMQTHNGFQWEIGKWIEAKGDISQGLCSDAWLHCYELPLLAVLHNPIHANIKNPRLFEVEVDGESKFDSQLKCGFRRIRLVKEIPLLEITTMQKIAYGILCAKEVYTDKQWNEWADSWLSEKNKTADAAAYAAVYAAANAAAHAAAHAAVYAAYAADAADAAADAAARAINLNLIDISKKAMKY